jgi:hypothetical protein
VEFKGLTAAAEEDAFEVDFFKGDEEILNGYLPIFVSRR